MDKTFTIEINPSRYDGAPVAGYVEFSFYYLTDEDVLKAVNSAKKIAEGLVEINNCGTRRGIDQVELLINATWTSRIHDWKYTADKGWEEGL